MEPNLRSCYRITWVCTPPTYWPIKQPVEHQGGKSSWIPMEEADQGWTSGYEVSRYLHWKWSSIPMGWVADFKTVKDKLASLAIPVQDKKKKKQILQRVYQDKNTKGGRVNIGEYSECEWRQKKFQSKNRKLFVYIADIKIKSVINYTKVKRKMSFKK